MAKDLPGGTACPSERSLDYEIDEHQESVNRELHEYYDGILEKCEAIPFRKVPHSLVKKMSEIIQYRGHYGTDWKNLMALMGIEDIVTLEKISNLSSQREESAVYFALTTTYVEQSGNLAVVLRVLKSKRLDVLQDIKEDVIEFLKNIEEEEDIHNYSLEFRETAEIENTSFPILPQGKNEYNVEKINDYLKGISNSTESFKELKRIQCSSYWADSLKLNKILNLAPQTNLSLFITHCDANTEDALTLAKAFRANYGFRVVAPKEVNFLLPINSSEAYDHILKTVDFIVPIVSQEYLNEIEADQDETTSTSNSLNVRYIFKLLHNEYVNKFCCNYRVRPASLGVRFFDVRDNLLLREILPLWADFSTLAENLIKGKELLSQQ